MISSQEIKNLFAQLPISSQTELLDELLQEQELQGKVLIAAPTTNSREKKEETLSKLHKREGI